MTETGIEIELDIAPIRYKIEFNDPKNFDREMKKLMTFIRSNDTKLLEAVSEVTTTRRKNVVRQTAISEIECRMPEWFYKCGPAANEAIALFLYFIDKPLTTTVLTEVINKEWKRIDLRNISKHLTSKGKSLFGYTVRDIETKTYTLSKYGRKWVEDKLIPKLTKKVEKRSDNEIDIGVE